MIFWKQRLCALVLCQLVCLHFGVALFCVNLGVCTLVSPCVWSTCVALVERQEQLALGHRQARQVRSCGARGGAARL